MQFGGKNFFSAKRFFGQWENSSQPLVILETPDHPQPVPENHKLSFFIIRAMQNGSCLKAPASLHYRPYHSQNPSPSL